MQPLASPRLSRSEEVVEYNLNIDRRRALFFRWAFVLVVAVPTVLSAFYYGFGRLLYLPVKTYSSGMRARLAFALTLAIDFECFLVDEVIAVGDQRFQRKCYDALFVERQHRAMVLASHDLNIVRSYCDKALVLKAGRGRVFDDLDLAIDIYNTL